MKYESLYSLYYKDNQIWEKVYQERFHSPFSRHLPLAIKQYHRRQSHPAFFCYTEEIALSLEKIASEVMDCLDIIHQVPPAAISQFLHMSLVDEIKSTNDIEGVRSTRKEILMAFSVPESEQSSYRLGSIVNKYIKIIQKEYIPLTTSQDIRQLFRRFFWPMKLNEMTPKISLMGKSFVRIVSTSSHRHKKLSIKESTRNQLSSR